MKLNKIEFMLVNNPVRAHIQEVHEVKVLREMSAVGSPASVLEIGCGNGNGAKLIRKYFNPGNIEAIDIDERMIYIARKRNKDNKVKFHLMSAAQLEFPDKSFDAVFDFGIIHHLADWRSCISELKRVLKPGGELIIEEMSSDSFSTGMGKVLRKILDHPYDQMYSNNEFVQFLKDKNFEITSYAEYNVMNMFSHICLVAVKK